MNFELCHYVTKTSAGRVDHEASDSRGAAVSRSLCGAAGTEEERRRHEPGPQSLRAAPRPPRAPRVPTASRPLAHLGKSRRTTQRGAIDATNRPWRSPARGEHRSAKLRSVLAAALRRTSPQHRTARAGPPRNPPSSAPAPSLRAGPSSGQGAAAALPGGAGSLAQRTRGHRDRGHERGSERGMGTAPRPHLGHLRAQVDLLEVDGVAAQVVEQLAQQHAVAQRLRQVEDLGRVPGDPMVGR